MKIHKGMRPQDIVILLKIISLSNKEWRYSDIASSISISQSEISEALNRCLIAKLIDNKKRNVHINSLFEFLVYGLKYVFPAVPGAIVKGIATAHSAPPLKEYFGQVKDNYVWTYARGKQRGQAIDPLYKTLPGVVEQDKLFYELLAITDTLRIGKAREIKIAVDELKKRLNV